MQSMPWIIERKSRNITMITMDAPNNSWEQWVLLRSDAHTDNLKNIWAFEQKHLQQAKERQAIIIDNGDLFCAMQGKYDPRKDYDQMRPELKGKNYLDLLVQFAGARYADYAANFAVLGMGNHEYSILDRLNTNLTERLAERLAMAAKRQGFEQQAVFGGYGGWVIFKFWTTKTQQHTRLLKHYHGSGGAAPVTRGVIQTNRQAVIMPDANYVLSGHSHDQWVVPIRRERVNNRGKLYLDLQYHIRAGTYKEDYGDGADGWHITTGKPPKVVGAVWMRFTYDGSGRIMQEFIPDSLDYYEPKHPTPKPLDV